jgi:hypothetical protein
MAGHLYFTVKLRDLKTGGVPYIAVKLYCMTLQDDRSLTLYCCRSICVSSKCCHLVTCGISCLFVRFISKPVRNNATPVCAAAELSDCTLRYSDRGAVLRSSAQILLSSETNRYFPSLSLDVPGAVVGYDQLQVFSFKS